MSIRRTLSLILAATLSITVFADEDPFANMSIAEQQRILKDGMHDGLDAMRRKFPGMEERLEGLAANISAAETDEGLTKPQLTWLIGPPGTGKTFFLDQALEYAGVMANRVHRHRVTEKNDVRFEFSGVINAERPVEGVSQLQAVLFYDEVMQMRPFSQLTVEQATERAETILSMDVLLADGNHELSREDFLGSRHVPRETSENPFHNVAAILERIIKDYKDYNRAAEQLKLDKLKAKLEEAKQNVDELTPAAETAMAAVRKRYAAYENRHSSWQERHSQWEDEKYEAERESKPFKKAEPKEPKWNGEHLSNMDLTDAHEGYKAAYKTRSQLGAQEEALSREIRNYDSFRENSLEELEDNIVDIRRYFPRQIDNIRNLFNLELDITHVNDLFAEWMFTNPRKLLRIFRRFQIPDIIKLPRNNIIMYFAGNPNEILTEAKQRFTTYEGEKTPDVYRQILAEIGTPKRVQDEVAKVIGLDHETIKAYIENLEASGKEVPSVLARLLNSIWAMRSRYAIESIELELPPSNAEYRVIVETIAMRRLSVLDKQYSDIEIDVDFTEIFGDWFYAQTVDPIGSVRFTAENATRYAQSVFNVIEQRIRQLRAEGKDYSKLSVTIDADITKSDGDSTTLVFNFEATPKGKSPIAIDPSEKTFAKSVKSWEQAQSASVTVGPKQTIYHQLGHVVGSLLEFGAFPLERLDWSSFESNQSLGSGNVFRIASEDGMQITETLNLMKVLLYSGAFEKVYDMKTPEDITALSSEADLDIAAAEARARELIRAARVADARAGVNDESKIGPNLQRLLRAAGVGSGDLAVNDYTYANENLAKLIVDK
ncbi:MAG: hypothetical protein AAF202_04085, partial [Pseudomonadota bacterium]